MPPPNGRTWTNIQIERDKAWEVYERASKLDERTAFALGASRDKFDKIPALRFDEAAHVEFLEYRANLERRLRSGEMSPALEGHLAK